MIKASNKDDERSRASKQLSAKELIGLFKHFDTMVAGKENLFVPISVGLIVAVIIEWKNLTPELVSLAGLASLSLYAYHWLHIRRFAAYQDAIFTKLGAQRSDFEELTKYPRMIGIRRLRVYFFAILVVLWVALAVLRAVYRA